jgi:hypothetical protein
MNYTDLRVKQDELQKKQTLLFKKIAENLTLINEMEREWDFQNCSGGGKCCIYFGDGAKCSSPNRRAFSRYNNAVHYLKLGIFICPNRKETK